MEMDPWGLFGLLVTRHWLWVRIITRSWQDSSDGVGQNDGHREALTQRLRLKNQSQQTPNQSRLSGPNGTTAFRVPESGLNWAIRAKAKTQNPDMSPRQVGSGQALQCNKAFRHIRPFLFSSTMNRKLRFTYSIFQIWYVIKSSSIS